MPSSAPDIDRSRRAPAMSPDERRAAIVAATLPLLLERGLPITTRQIAEAAGIAEGTIFRVFPTIDAVVEATVEAAFDQAPTERALAAIDPSLPLDEALVEAAAIVQSRVSVVWRLVTLVGKGPRSQAPQTESAAVAALFARHAAQVRLDPTGAARRFRAVALALSHPILSGDDPLPPREIVSLFLDGARRPSDDRGRQC
jgi:AcrR family transcriptional regulator